MHVQRHVVGLLKDEGAFDEEEAAYAQQGIVQTHADQAPVVVKVKALVGDLQGQHAAFERALEVDVGAHAIQVAPLAALVGIDLQLIKLELEQHPVDVDLRVPVDLQGVQVGNDTIGVGRIGWVHEHQAEVDVVQRDAPTVLIDALVAVKQAVVVLVNEVRAHADKNVDVGGGQEGRCGLQVLNATVVGRDAFDLGQARLERRVVLDLFGRQARADVNEHRLGLLKVKAAADVDVVGNRQRGTVYLQTQNLAPAGIGAHRLDQARSGHDLVFVQRHHATGSAQRAFHTVHLQADALGHQGKAINAHKADAVGAGRQGGP